MDKPARSPLPGPGKCRDVRLCAWDAEDGEGPGWVAAVVSQRGGDVGPPGQAQCTDGEIAQAGHGAGPGAGADLGGVLGKGHLADPVQGVLESLRRLRLWVVNKRGS